MHYTHSYGALSPCTVHTHAVHSLHVLYTLIRCTHSMYCAHSMYCTHSHGALTPCTVHTHTVHSLHVLYTLIRCTHSMYCTHSHGALTPCTADIHTNNSPQPIENSRNPSASAVGPSQNSVNHHHFVLIGNPSRTPPEQEHLVRYQVTQQIP